MEFVIVREEVEKEQESVDENRIVNKAVDREEEVGDQEETDENDRNFDDWVEEQDEEVHIKSLFNEDVLASVELLVSHDFDLFNFDLKLIVSENCSDDASVIMLINFIRSKVAKIPSVNQDFITDLLQQIESKVYLQNEEYMKPVIEDDPLLYLYEDSLIIMESETD